MLRDDLKELNITIQELSKATKVPECVPELLADGKLIYSDLRYDDATAILDYLIEVRKKRIKRLELLFNSDGFDGCETVSEVVDRYLIYKEMDVELAVLDWNMYAYLNDNLADGLWEKSRGVKHEG